MIEWVFSGIGVAALVGLSGMAVARPAQYDRLAPYLGAAGFVVAVAMCAYQLGASNAQQAARLTKLSDSDSWNRINDATAGVPLPTEDFFVLAGVFAYLGVLWALPAMGVVEKKE